MGLISKAAARPNAALSLQGRALLHWACDRGHKELVSLLLQHKADINSQVGRSFFFFFVILCFPEAVKHTDHRCNLIYERLLMNRSPTADCFTLQQRLNCALVYKYQLYSGLLFMAHRQNRVLNERLERYWSSLELRQCL